MTASDRTHTGQFAPGNKAGHGNPFARQVAALRSRLIQSATPEDIDKVAALLKDKALAGDLAAIKLWLSYVVGKPSEPPDPDTIDSHDLKVRRQNTAVPEDMRRLAEAVPASMMCDVASVMQPHLSRHLAEEFMEGVRDFLAAPKPTGEVRDPLHPWRVAGLSEEAAGLFDDCPAWLRIGAERSSTTPNYTRALDGLGHDLLARIQARQDAAGGRWVTRPVIQRPDSGPGDPAGR